MMCRPIVVIMNASYRTKAFPFQVADLDDEFADLVLGEFSERI